MKRKSAWLSLAVLLALTGATFISCGEKAPADGAVRLSKLKKGAQEAYEAAKPAVASGDYEIARISFEKAIAADTTFTEAWYNLGATLAMLSISAMRQGDETGAVDLFRQAVAAKKRARELISRGRWYVYQTKTEQDQVVSDLENALADADEVMNDERSLVPALKLWAGMQ
jgi:Tfp pilus assembly protein PilF